MFIHELDTWPTFTWNVEAITSLQLDVMRSLAYLSGRMSAIGFDVQMNAAVEAFTNDIVASSQIEGLHLDTDEVRSSVARKLGVHINKSKDITHYVDGIVEMMLDATHNMGRPLSKERLFEWHRALFPNKVDISVGTFRIAEMSVVSGTFGREKLHYRAPSPDRVNSEMDHFLNWLNSANNDAILKSAIAHIWFVSIHPFDDGNGRIARAISDMVLTTLDSRGKHFYSLSRQILKDKARYYRVLEQTQRGNGDITDWLTWYFNAIISAVEDANSMLSQVLQKAIFWSAHSQVYISERQRMVLNTYLDGYEAKITAKNWQKLTGVSKDTALRDIDALVEKGILVPTHGRVRDVPYSINYATKNDELNSFSATRVLSKNGFSYIETSYKSGTPIQERLTDIDVYRFNQGEISLDDLTYKYFAYLFDPE